MIILHFSQLERPWFYLVDKAAFGDCKWLEYPLCFTCAIPCAARYGLLICWECLLDLMLRLFSGAASHAYSWCFILCCVAFHTINAWISCFMMGLFAAVVE